MKAENKHSNGVSRRAFLKSAAATAAVAAGIATNACAADDAAWPLAVRLASYGKYQDAAWQHLPSIGVRYVFLSVPKPEELDSVVKKLKENNLTALVIRGDTDLSKETCVDELAAQLAICEKMGVKYMFISAKRNNAEKAVVYDRLRRAGDAAKKHGVTITLETHPDLGTNGDVQIETMKAINHPNVRVNFDTANITYYNKGTDALTELKKSIDYVRTVEFKDHNHEFETWNFPVVGKGKVDFPGIVKLLKEHGYKGPVTIEFEGVKGVELNEEETKKSIADSVAYVKSIGQFK